MGKAEVLIDKKHEWALEDIYSSVADWEADYLKVSGELDFSEFKGKLSEKSAFLACVKKQEKVVRVIEKLSVYAMMLSDGDTANSAYSALTARATSLGAKYGEETAFFTPELTALSEEKLNAYIADADLSDCDYFLKGILKEKAHVLSEESEKILAGLTETFSSFRDIFTKIDNADLPFPSIKVGGEKITVSHGAYGVLMQNPNREVRKKCFKSYYGAYVSLINTISETYYGSVKKDVFTAKLRKYDSALSRALFSEDVPETLYSNLIKAVNDALPLLHAYMGEKARALNLKRLNMYDVYVPCTEGCDIKLDYDKAYELVIKGLAPLGKEYGALLKKAYDERWISVNETKNKRSGAYSVAVYDTHPYVLLNYKPTTHDVFTIAHEMGHSIHSYFSNRSQPYFKADYKIFVAEVASTVNEVLLIKYLLKTSEDAKLKKYLLSYLMEMIRTTLFRQTQFSEFEEFSHSEVEKGIPLTKDSMCEKYLELNRKYYGKYVISNEEIKYEWARIPHFYRAFYVYKYSTGIISALSIAERILTEGAPAVKDYFKFLSSGDSDSPVNLLKIAGVDLTEEKPFTAAFKVFEDALNEFAKL